MRLSHLALAAASVSALLVVPEVTPEEEDALFSILPFDTGADLLAAHTSKNSISVPCRQCRGEDAHLELDFEMRDGFVFVNGKSLYPEFEGGFSAQVKKEHDQGEENANLSVAVIEKLLGFDDEQDMDARELWFSIHEVNGIFMDDIPSVKLQLVTSRAMDQSYLGQIELIEPVEGSQCDKMLCHIMDVIKQTVKKVKGLGKGKGCQGRPHRQGRPMMAGGEDEHRPHHHYHHQHAHHGHDGKMLRGFIIHIFVPVVLGVVAGVGCGLLAMVITSIIMHVVSRIKGRKESSHSPVNEESSTAEKARLMDDDDLPQYESAPAYKQVQDGE